MKHFFSSLLENDTFDNKKKDKKLNNNNEEKIENLSWDWDTITLRDISPNEALCSEHTQCVVQFLFSGKKRAGAIYLSCERKIQPSQNTLSLRKLNLK